MAPLNPWLVAAGLVGLFALLIPFGLLVLRIGERLLRFRPRLLPPERLLLGGYASGTVLFVLASIGLPLFTEPIVLALGVLGIVAMAFLWIRERGTSLAPGVRWLVSWPALVVVAGFLGLLALEVYGVAAFSFSNAYDGATHSLWVNVLLANHGIPWTVQPFADIGITYPQGAPVWEALPPLLLGWPIAASPLFVPTLFFALSVPAAYVLGVRLSDRGGPRPEIAGAAFAAFFALVAAFPRLFLGGSYDLAFAFPLFLLILGWIPWFVGRGPRPWNEVGAFAIVAGAASALSWMIGVEVLTLLIGFELAMVLLVGARVRAAAARCLVVLLVTLAFLARSLVGTAMWFSYPGRVLNPVGSRPYALVPPGSALTYQYVTGELDPLVPFKARLSPVPWMSVLIAILLVAGVVLIVLAFARPPGRWRSVVSSRLARTISLAAIVTFLDVTALLVLGSPASPVPDVTTLTNVDELSVLLFLLLGIIALLPLLACASVLERAGESQPDGDPHGAADDDLRSRPRRRGDHRSGVTAVAIALLVVGFGAGAASTVVDLPGYIHDHIQSIANVTAGDVDALAWSGANLPGCARVFVAPGSAAEYLPEYASVHVDFPAFPAVYNLSYTDALSALTAGTYNQSVRADLLSLGIDAVFVTARTTVQFPPLNASPLDRSSDFARAYESGDAVIFAFLPGVSETGCAVPLEVGESQIGTGAPVVRDRTG